MIVRAASTLSVYSRPQPVHGSPVKLLVAICVAALLLAVDVALATAATDDVALDAAGESGSSENDSSWSYAIQRFPENPIIRPEMLPGSDGSNIAGPSLIEVPNWVPNRLAAITSTSRPTMARTSGWPTPTNCTDHGPYTRRAC